ncbi:conserved hypothetical protein [Leishmania braziliensis MHOM/BR/75/M2904]|uniref:Uncharacterized protein n=2 Tax=Leishmania braziliensis TaxID=5660 RepID=A4H929_LEIBR|nr:conserved hypothetical protein [Leishmania braziliensis MHOM/BR/75/M2904]CAJ2477231.1 unnamed protein product [Leishmania braziliensis]CAM37898.2 conserved hypothetical protein [Leishmania braziliensis MHOM/BR/75/M2904]
MRSVAAAETVAAPSGPETSIYVSASVLSVSSSAGCISCAHMSQSPLASSTVSEGASASPSTDSCDILSASSSSALTDAEDTAATASVTLSVFTCSSVDGDADAGAPPVLRDSMWSLGAPLVNSSAITTVMAVATDVLYQPPEDLPSLQPLPSTNAVQLRGSTANVAVMEHESGTEALQAVQFVSLSNSHDNPGSLGEALSSTATKIPSSPAFSGVVSDASTLQHGVASSLPTATLAPPAESSVLFVPTVATDPDRPNDILAPSLAGASLASSDSSSLSQSQERARTTPIVACDSAEATTRVEHLCMGISLPIGESVSSPAICCTTASTGGQSAAHSQPSPPLADLSMSAITPDRKNVVVQLPRVGNAEGGVSGEEALLDSAETHVAFGDTRIAEPTLSLSSVTADRHGGESPQAESGAAFEASTKATPLLTQPVVVSEKPTLPTAPASSGLDAARHDRSARKWCAASAESPATPKAANAPPASRKRRRVSLMSPHRQSRLPVEQSESEEKLTEEAEPTPSLSAHPGGGPLLATAVECMSTACAGEGTCKRFTWAQTHAPATVSLAVRASGDDGDQEEKRQVVRVSPGEAHKRDAADVDVGSSSLANERVEPLKDLHKPYDHRARIAYGAQADSTAHPCPRNAPLVTSTGHVGADSDEEASTMSPPQFSVATGASAATGRTTANSLSVSNLTTDSALATSGVNSARSKRSARNAQGTTAAPRKETVSKVLTKEAVTPAPSLSAPSKPVLNLAGVNVQALLAEGTDPPPLYTRRQRRTRRRSALAEDHPLFAEHRDLWENDPSGRIFPRAPFASDADVLNSLIEWTDSPALVYAQLLWRYVPGLFLRLAMHDGDVTPCVKVEPKVEADTRMKQEKME